MTDAQPKSDLEQFVHLLGQGLLIRASVSRSELSSSYEHFLIEIVSLLPDVYEGGLRRDSGIVRMQWSCGYVENEGHLHSSPLYFPLVKTETIAGMEAEEIAKCMAKILLAWRNGITGDGARPYREWLNPTPFAAIASLGIRPKTVTGALREDARPLLVYFGRLLGQLEAYEDQLKYIGKIYDSTDDRHRVIKHLSYRWRHFVHNIQQRQLDVVFS